MFVDCITQYQDWIEIIYYNSYKETIGQGNLVYCALYTLVLEDVFKTLNGQNKGTKGTFIPDLMIASC